MSYGIIRTKNKGVEFLRSLTIQVTPPQLFEIDTLSLNITRTVTITNAENVDWEDIDQDENYIYIGDFGNNDGNRQNLSIYRISKTDYSTSTTILADKIEFSYEDQINFSTTQNSDWDAEALVVLNDELIVFTKQWQSNGTVAYSVPKEPGVYKAINKGMYPIQGLVTGATMNSLTNELFIVGYSQILTPFIAIVSNISEGNIFNGTVQKTNLDIGLAQIEAIAQVGENTFFISSEKFVNNSPPITLEAKLFSLKMNNQIEIPEEEGENIEEVEEENKEVLVLFKAYGSNLLQYKLNTKDEVLGNAIFNSSGQRLTLYHGERYG